MIKKQQFQYQLPSGNVLGYFSAQEENIAAKTVQLDEDSSWHDEAVVSA